MARQGRGGGATAVWVAIAVTLAGPLLVLIAMLLVGGDVISLETGLDLLTLKVAFGLSVLAVVVAVVAMIGAFRNLARMGLIGLATLAVAIGVLSGFVWRMQVMATAGPLDVSTDLADPPLIAGASNPSTGCPGLVALSSQAAQGSAGWAMQQAGFRITEAGLFQVRGERIGPFFGLRHEAVIRIRPGRTDVRVVARDDRADGGETCHLAGRLVEQLQARR